MHLHHLFRFICGWCLVCILSFPVQAQNTSDVILQGFYWNTHPGDLSAPNGFWWDTLAFVAPQIGEAGFKTVWTPPANKGFAGSFDMGYGIYDYYDFGSFNQKGTVRTRHGNAAELSAAINAMHQAGLNVMADVVLNHRAGAEATQPEDCDDDDNFAENRFTDFQPASGRLPMDSSHFHPNQFPGHCDLNGPYHDRVFFEDLCYFNNFDQVLDPTATDDGWYFGPHNLGSAGDSLIVWGRYLLDEMGFDEIRLDAVKHIEPGALAPWLVELNDGDQPFAVGELFDGNLGTLAGYNNEVEQFNTTFGAGSKDANLAIFDFNLRFAIRDMCNGGGGFNMANLNSNGLLFGSNLTGEDIVTFVENHDFDRIGYVVTSCSDPDTIQQVGSTCLKFGVDSGHDPVIFDKHIGYAYIMAAEGRPSVFWKDWFWFGLDEEIRWQMALRAKTAAGGSQPMVNLGPSFITGNDSDLFVLNRYGEGQKTGQVLALNDGFAEASAFVNTPFVNAELKDYSDAYLFFQTAAFNDSRAFVKAGGRNYAWYAPTGQYPQPPNEDPSSFSLGNHQGAKLHFVALRAQDAANLFVNGAPIEVGDEIAILPVGTTDAVGLGRIGQSFRWDGQHDMLIEVLGGGNSSEAKGGLIDNDAWRLAIYDQSSGTMEIAGFIQLAPNGTTFTFNPDRPASKGGSFSINATHDTPTYQTGGISLITAFDTRAIVCSASNASGSAYDDGFQGGDNDGTGFGAWILSTNNNNGSTGGHFVFTSTDNGDGDSNSDGDIDSNGEAWGFYANSGDRSEAVRPFNQALAPGNTFSIQMDNGWIDGGGQVGFDLENASGEDLLRFYFEGGQSSYTLVDNSGTIATGISFSDEGFVIDVTLTGSTSYDISVARLEGGSFSTSGSLLSPSGGTDIAQVRVFNQNAGGGGQRNAYFNNLEICSLPTCPIASVSAGSQSACNPADNTYSQDIIVGFNSVPAGGQLVVNGVSVPLNVVNNQQTVTLTGLVSDGQAVDVTAVLTGDTGCTLSAAGLFTAPTDCKLPVIDCPDDIVVDNDFGQCTAVVNYPTPSGTDNLPGATTSQLTGLGSGAAFPVGVTTETYEVTDAGNNTASCFFTVTVNDVENPSAKCNDLTISLVPNGTASIAPSEVDNNSADNCGPVDLSLDQENFSCADLPGVTVTLTVTDQAANTSSCTASITILDSDTDGDGVGNCSDNCPDTPNTDQADADNDGIGDVCDTGNDNDNDGIANDEDNCPDTPNSGQADSDGDGIGNVCDNCPNNFNSGQADSDGDGIGNACDQCPGADDLADPDGDGIPGCLDNCPNTPNSGQADNDNDGVGNVCDNCPNNANSGQADNDNDGVGNVCDQCPGTDDNAETMDTDGIPDCQDNCPADNNSGQADADGDGVGNPCDNCPNDYNAGQADSDGDGVGNVCDQCPGTDDNAETMDTDGIPDCQDNCPADNNSGQADADGDGVGNPCDNCPNDYNAGQADSDGDGVGNVCDQCPGEDDLADPDGDGILGCLDNCPNVPNSGQADNDNDGVGNVCDNCPNNANSGQADSDGDGVGNVCDQCPGTDDNAETMDTDGIPDCQDNCPADNNSGQADNDNDGVGNACDNCPNHANSGQADDDGDGVGNVCDLCPGEDDLADPDGDGIPGCLDNCPNTPNSGQADNDADGVGNVCDNCPNNANSGQADNDNDGVGNVCDQCPGTDDNAETMDTDGIPDCIDNCPADNNSGQADSDGDGVGNPCDNCPDDYNAGQADSDGDGVGNKCDQCPGQDDNAETMDTDGIPDCQDNCPGINNPGQADSDGDGVGNPCDNCPNDANSGQADSDGDGVGNKCDQCPGQDDLADPDGDGVLGCRDNCPDHFNPGQADNDGDGVGNPCDNCPNDANSGQADNDNDGVGNKCDNTPEGLGILDPGKDELTQLRMEVNGPLNAIPNPFRSEVTIMYSLEEAGNIQLEVFDLEGKRVQSLQTGFMAEGEHQVRWDVHANGYELSTGIYILRLQTAQGVQTKRLVLMN